MLRVFFIMNVLIDCISCLFKQLVEILELCNADETVSRRVMSRVADFVKNFQYDCTPPEMALKIMAIVEEETGVEDPYKAAKDESNRMASKFYPRLKEIVAESDDRLLTAVEAAISGNIIDYGAKGHFDIDEEMHKLFNELNAEPKEVFDYVDFKTDLSKIENVLYLLDNTGEIYFDKVLIEQLLSQGKKVVAVVRGGPIINDVTMDDAVNAGLTEITSVISNGVAIPGTVLKLCSDEFISAYNKADLIISKGQGNYETLEKEYDERIYFLFKVKCPIVAQESNCTLGSIVLKKQLMLEL